MGNRMYNLLNKNVKEFNRPLLFLSCFLFLVLVGLLSYVIDTGSFAFFEFNVNGSKSLTGTYLTRPSYVYVFDEDVIYYVSQDLNGGDTTLFCELSDTGVCKHPGEYYSTLALCQSATLSSDCSETMVDLKKVNYTYKSSALDNAIYLKHNIDSNNKITSSDVCYKLNSTEWCLKGGISSQYNTNKTTLQNSFGSSNCTNSTNSYKCTSGTLTAEAMSSGKVTVSDSTYICDSDVSGESRCGVDSAQ